jgi:hypothetical protein
MGDKIVCFHTLLKVLILREVAGRFSISADSKALAKMERAVSPLLTSPMDQCALPLYTLNHYTMLFIFVKGKTEVRRQGPDVRRVFRKVEGP